MSKKGIVRDFLTWTGIAVLGASLGAGGMYLLTDGIHSKYAKMGQGLILLVDGVHLKKGTHNYVITDKFSYKLTSFNSEEDQKMIIDGLKEAYTTLDNYNSQLNFRLATTVDEIAEKYNIPKVDKVGKQDIALNMTDEVLDGNERVMAHTDWHYNMFNYEMEDLSITFRTKYANAVWKEYETIEETLSAKNTVIYTMAIHESLHSAGYAHNDHYVSIMNTYTNSKSPKDVTNYDIEMMDKYNVQFYGAEPTVKISEDSLKTVASYAKTEEELGM